MLADVVRDRRRRPGPRTSCWCSSATASPRPATSRTRSARSATSPARSPACSPRCTRRRSASSPRGGCRRSPTLGERWPGARDREEVARGRGRGAGRGARGRPVRAAVPARRDGGARSAGVAGARPCDAPELAARRGGERESRRRAARRDGAVALPVAAPGRRRPAAALVLGVNPRGALDDDHRRFFRADRAPDRRGARERRGPTRPSSARADALAELDRAKTEFFANVSHEFRTPLMLMLGPLADALARPGAGRAQHERIAIANRGALRMLRLVNALLDFSRVEAGRATARFAPRRPRRASCASPPPCSAPPRSARASSCASTSPTATTRSTPTRTCSRRSCSTCSPTRYKFTFEGAIDVRVRMGERARRSRSPTPASASPPTSSRALFERFHRVEGARGRSTRGQRHRARARARARRAPRRRGLGRRASVGAGQHVPGRAAAPPGRDGGRPPRRHALAEAQRATFARGGACAGTARRAIAVRAGRRAGGRAADRRRQRRPARVPRAAARHALRGAHRGRRRGRARAAARAPGRPRARRRDDAPDGRLRAARARCARTRAPGGCR